MSRPSKNGGQTTTAPPVLQVAPGREGGLGTFGGVFTPSILTILGVIMYLRFGWVLANVGLAGTLLIVTLATTITFLTALSISEIATDQRVRGGGAYYMISRSLGVETGGAVGLPLYVALTLSIALYTVGFAEAVVEVFPQLDARWVGLITTVLVAGLALTSARAAIRAQYFIMAAIALSLLALVFGQHLPGEPLGLSAGPAENAAPFWVVFAVFFPAVTGIMSGVNMSGDLKDPGRSIPFGTLAAVGVGYLIYMGLPILLATRASQEALLEEPLVMRQMAAWGPAIVLGVWGATLSSAVGSMLGAPRVLQALARDGVLPRGLDWLGRGSGTEDEPRNGTVLTLAIALGAVAIGDLNMIAPVLTMFFLTTYGVLNVVAGVERFLGSPSFRPQFRVHWGLSILGAIGCAGVMLLINPLATGIAGVVVLAIFVWLERREMTTAWGDVRRGVWMAITRAGLLRLRDPVDAKNWRPHMLVLSGAPTKRWHLIELARDLGHAKGLITVATVLPQKALEADRQIALESTIRDYIEKRGVTALVRVVPGEDPFIGGEMLAQYYGLGSIVPNTVILGGSAESDHRQRYCEMISRFHQAQRNVVLVHGGDGGLVRGRRRIDVWWGGLQRNGGLMTVLAYLLQTSRPWRNAEVHLKMVVQDERAADGCRSNLATLVARARTGAQIQVIVAEGRPFGDILREESAGADVVFLGLAKPDPDDMAAFTEYYAQLIGRIAPLPTTLMVLAAEDLAFGEVLLEQDF